MSDNKEICSRLAQLAREYFLEVSEEWKSGTYTATEAHEMLLEKNTGLKVMERINITSEKPPRKEKVLDFTSNASYVENPYVKGQYTKTYNVMNSGKQLSVEVGTFKASFDACKVFYYLAKFEALAKLSVKEKTVFIREEEREEPVMSFDVTVTKEMAVLAGCTGDDNLRPIMNYVHIDVDNQCAVVTDGHILSVHSMPIAGMFDSDKSDHRIVIVPKQMMKAPGTYHIYQYRIGECDPKEFITEATKVNNRSTIYESMPFNSWFPNYRSVIPRVHKEGYIKLKNPSDVKALFAFLKTVTAGQRTGVCKVMAHGRSYESRIYFTYEDLDFNKKNEVSFELETPIKHSFYFGINALHLLKIKYWTGGLWYTSPSRAMLFDDKHAHLYLIMPLQLNDDETKGLACEYLDDKKHKNFHIPGMERNAMPKQNLTITQPPVQEPDFISMKTNQHPYYYLPDVAEGIYEVRGESDPETKHAITSMAHYILKGDMLQPEFITYVREHFGRDPKKLAERYPLPETELATLFMQFLASKGIEEVPDYPAVGLAIAPAEEPNQVKSAEVITTTLDRDIEPIIELETEEGLLVVAADSYFHKLYDSDNECFRSEAARVKFNEIDAFISDELVYGRPLNLEAISEEVEMFLQEADNAV